MTDNWIMIMLMFFWRSWYRNSFLLARQRSQGMLHLEEEFVYQKMSFSLPLYPTWSKKILLLYVGVNFAFPMFLLKIIFAFLILILNFIGFYICILMATFFYCYMFLCILVFTPVSLDFEFISICIIHFY